MAVISRCCFGVVPRSANPSHDPGMNCGSADTDATACVVRLVAITFSSPLKSIKECCIMPVQHAKVDSTQAVLLTRRSLRDVGCEDDCLFVLVPMQPSRTQDAFFSVRSTGFAGIIVRSNVRRFRPPLGERCASLPFAAIQEPFWRAVVVLSGADWLLRHHGVSRVSFGRAFGNRSASSFRRKAICGRSALRGRKFNWPLGSSGLMGRLQCTT